MCLAGSETRSPAPQANPEPSHLPILCLEAFYITILLVKVQGESGRASWSCIANVRESSHQKTSCPTQGRISPPLLRVVQEAGLPLGVASLCLAEKLEKTKLVCKRSFTLSHLLAHHFNLLCEGSGI